MDKYIGNLASDILSIKDFEKEMITDKERGYDVGTSLDTLSSAATKINNKQDPKKPIRALFISISNIDITVRYRILPRFSW